MGNPYLLYLVPFFIGFFAAIVFLIVAVQNAHKSIFSGQNVRVLTREEKLYTQLTMLCLIISIFVCLVFLIYGRVKFMSLILLPVIMLIWLVLLLSRDKLSRQNKVAEVVPAVLSDDLNDYIRRVNEFKKFAGRIHIDIMDGVFVPTRSPNVKEIFQALAEDKETKFAVHLMVHYPRQELKDLKKFDNVELVYVHAEAVDSEIMNKKYPFQLGLVINPETKPKDFQKWLSCVPVVQIMTIHPGRQGAKFLPETLENVVKIRELGFEGEIHIDGHIDEKTLPRILEYHPDVLNVGSAITKNKHPEEEYETLKRIAERQR